MGGGGRAGGFVTVCSAGQVFQLIFGINGWCYGSRIQ